MPRIRIDKAHRPPLTKPAAAFEDIACAWCGRSFRVAAGASYAHICTPDGEE